MPTIASAQQRLTTAQAAEVQQLLRELANIRTQISSLDSSYRQALTAVATSIDRIDRGFFIAKQPGNVVTFVNLLNPVSRVVSIGVKGATSLARGYDAAIASIRAGNLTTTRRELVKLRLQIDNNRLDAIAPYLTRQRAVIARLNQLGVRNP